MTPIIKKKYSIMNLVLLKGTRVKILYLSIGAFLTKIFK